MMLIELLEMACNSALEHDLETHHRIEKLHGKSMALQVRMVEPVPNQTIVITPTPQGLEFSNDSDSSVDVTLTATLAAIIKISRDGMQQADLKPGELEINGDPIIGQQFAQLMSDLDINWETLLAEHIGEAPASALSMAAKTASEFASNAKGQARLQLNNLIVNEMQLVAAQTNVDQFLDDVDTLRAKTDRLELRITRLQQAL